MFCWSCGNYALINSATSADCFVVLFSVYTVKECRRDDLKGVNVDDGWLWQICKYLFIFPLCNVFIRLHSTCYLLITTFNGSLSDCFWIPCINFLHYLSWSPMLFSANQKIAVKYSPFDEIIQMISWQRCKESLKTQSKLKLRYSKQLRYS